MLEDIKTLLGVANKEKDRLLNVLLTQTTDYVLEYCHLEELPKGLESAVENIVIIRYNLLGNEGVSGESYSGVSFNYDTSVPSHILTQLNHYRKVRTI